jgi:hypothetical protein
MKPGPLGRSMYALQIHQWFKELRRMGRDPKNAVRIVRLEDLKKGGPWAAQILNEIVDWVKPVTSVDQNHTSSTTNTPQSDKDATTTINHLKAFEHGMITNYTNLGSPKLSNKTKDFLDNLYTSHNKILSRLLQDERWMYERNEMQEDRPLVWPMRKEQDGGALFISPQDDGDLGPCASTIG